MVCRKTALIKGTLCFLSQVGNGILRKDQPFQGNDTVFMRKGGVTSKYRHFQGPYGEEVRSEKSVRFSRAQVEKYCFIIK
jgi:hypothetical protein